MSKVVWLVDDDASIRWVLERALRDSPLSVQSFAGAEECRAALAEHAPDVLLTDVRMPDGDGLALLQEARQRYPHMPVIIMTAHGDLDTSIAAFDAGAYDYLPKPFDVDEAVALLTRAAQHSEPASTPARGSRPALIGKTPAMQAVFRALGRLSRSAVNVLITGETGTGKELVARALHDNSPRAAQPFVAINTAAIPAELLESELFGHERGAFTGAQAQRRGRFEQAEGGTLLLDEIGDMPLALQTRLLRVLAEGEFYRVGGHAPIKSNVRILAATHQNLEALIADGRFREDLYHRLNVVSVHVPALRERRTDIALLANHFMQEVAAELDTGGKTLSAEALEHLSAHAWPGNVRELRNVCRRLTVLAPGQEVRAGDLPAEFHTTAPVDPAADWQTALRHWAVGELSAGRRAIGARAIAMAEQALIETALAHSGGHKQAAAKALGWGRNTLARKQGKENAQD